MDTPKKQYQTPALTVHGDVADITRELQQGADDTPEGIGDGFHAS